MMMIVCGGGGGGGWWWVEGVDVERLWVEDEEEGGIMGILVDVYACCGGDDVVLYNSPREPSAVKQAGRQAH